MKQRPGETAWGPSYASKPSPTIEEGWWPRNDMFNFLHFSTGKIRLVSDLQKHQYTKHLFSEKKINDHFQDRRASPQT